MEYIALRVLSSKIKYFNPEYIPSNILEEMRKVVLNWDYKSAIESTIEDIKYDKLDYSLPKDKSVFDADCERFKGSKFFKYPYMLNQSFSYLITDDKVVIEPIYNASDIFLSALNRALDILNTLYFESINSSVNINLMKTSNRTMGLIGQVEDILNQLKSYHHENESLEETIIRLCCPYIIVDTDVEYDINTWVKSEFSKTILSPFQKNEDAYNLISEPAKWLLQPLKINGVNSSDILFSKDDNPAFQSIIVENKTGSDIYNKISKLFILCQFMAICVTEKTLSYGKEVHDIAKEFVDNVYMYKDNPNITETGICPHLPSDFEYIMDIKKQYCTESKSISTEADGGYFVNSVNNESGARIDEINESYKSKGLNLKKAFIDAFKIKPERRKMLKRADWFKKYIGRIPSLYERYGSTAEVFENEMVDDPSNILTKTCVEYLTQMSDFSVNLFNELVQMAEKIASANDLVEKMQLVKSYCKQFPIENDKDPKVIAHSIKGETLYRIAYSIFQNIKVYGFTIEGVLANGEFPSANLIVISMFVSNPNEKAVRQPVSNIFKTPESLTIFANPDSILKFDQLYKTTSSKVIDTYDPKVAANSKKAIMRATNRYADQMKQNNGQSDQEQMDPKLSKQIAKAIEKGITESTDLVIEQKKRVLQCMGIAHDMVDRITSLAQKSVYAMLEVESQKTDKQVNGKDMFNSGRDTAKNGAVAKKLDKNRQNAEGLSDKQKFKKVAAHNNMEKMMTGF